MNAEYPWKKRRPFFFLLIPIAIAGLTLLVMCLWNWLMPELFGLPRLHFWQALVLFALSRLLFGSFRFRGGPPFIKERLKEKWGNMSEEERTAFKSKWRNRCGPKQEDNL